MRLVVLGAILVGLAWPAYAQTTSPAPVRTEELMARVIKFVLALEGSPPPVSKRLATIFGLGDDQLPARQAASEEADGKHYVTIPIQRGGKDIIFTIRSIDGKVDFYLTDNRGALRAAAVLDSTSGLRLITKEQAAEKFKAEMARVAMFAKKLPAQ